MRNDSHDICEVLEHAELTPTIFARLWSVRNCQVLGQLCARPQHPGPIFARFRGLRGFGVTLRAPTTPGSYRVLRLHYKKTTFARFRGLGISQEGMELLNSDGLCEVLERSELDSHDI